MALVPEGTAVEAVEEPTPGSGGLLGSGAGPAVVLPFPRRQVFAWMAAAAGVLMAVTIWSVSRLGQEPELAAMRVPPEGPAPMSAPPASTAAPAGGAAAADASSAIAARSADRERRLARAESA